VAQGLFAQITTTLQWFLRVVGGSAQRGQREIGQAYLACFFGRDASGRTDSLLIFVRLDFLIIAPMHATPIQAERLRPSLSASAWKAVHQSGGWLIVFFVEGSFFVIISF
jgi:hypothetical protein